MKLFQRFDIDFDPDAMETYLSKHGRLFISAAVALLVLMGIVAVTVLGLALRGGEQTMVPNVVGKELTAALLELQAKELYPRIQLRYSNSATDKGNILEQDPRPGTIVKAGRRIRLVVSRGMVVDKVENYIGQNIDDVKIHLQTLFATASRPLLSLREPPLYKYSSEPAGTVLEQKPEPGTNIDGPTQLELVVSRGPENAMIKVPDVVGLPFTDALERLRQAGVWFTCSSRPAESRENPGAVVSQLPAGQAVVAANTVVNLVIAEPASLPEGKVFGIFSQNLPQYPYPLEIKLDAISPSGDRKRIFVGPCPGGDVTLPYQVDRGSVLVLSVLNREIIRKTVE